jgi:uncharacterized protein
VKDGPQVQSTNCHVHTFTQAHTPSRSLPWPIPARRASHLSVATSAPSRVSSTPDRKTALGPYAQILDTSYSLDQEKVFEIVRGFYPHGTRCVVLPMDMTQMNAGAVRTSIADQHAEIARLRDRFPDTVIPFAAVDPRHPGIVKSTIELIEQHGFRGLKLYPPIGYHPYDTRLHDLYAYANEHHLPLLSHCSRPASVQYRDAPTAEMRRDPENNNAPLNLSRKAVLTRFTRPDAYLPILTNFPNIRVCLAHFGGAPDWSRYLNRPWISTAPHDDDNWLARILQLVKSGEHHPNLWTDIAYTLFADDEYVYLLRALLADPNVRARVLGSDFYVVEHAELEERSRARSASAPSSAKSTPPASPRTTRACFSPRSTERERCTGNGSDGVTGGLLRARQ